MSILDKIKQKAEDKTISIINKQVEGAASDFISKNVAKSILNNKSVQDYLDKENKTATFMRYIRPIGKSARMGFIIYDESFSKKYNVRFRGTAKHPSLHLLDLDKNELGKVTTSSYNRRWDFYNYAAYLDNERLGEFIQQFNMGIKVSFKVSFNNWYIESNPVRINYSVINQNKEKVMEITSAYTGSDEGEIIIKFENRTNEIIGLIIGLVILENIILTNKTI